MGSWGRWIQLEHLLERHQQRDVVRLDRSRKEVRGAGYVRLAHDLRENFWTGLEHAISLPTFRLAGTHIARARIDSDRPLRQFVVAQRHIVAHRLSYFARAKLRLELAEQLDQWVLVRGRDLLGTTRRSEVEDPTVTQGEHRIARDPGDLARGVAGRHALGEPPEVAHPERRADSRE